MDDDFFYKHAGADDEIFKYIPGYDDLYIVSSKGYILSTRSDNILEVSSNRDKYFEVNLKDKDGNKKKIKLHTIMARTFLKKPEGKNIVIDHINGINTDNRLENLRYVSQSINCKNAFITGNNKGSGKIICKLDDEGNVLKRYKSILDACRDNGIKYAGSVHRCLANPKSNYKAGGFGWRYSKSNKKYIVTLQKDEVFKKLVSKKYKLNFPQYELSNYGNLRVVKTGKFIKPRIINGYYYINLLGKKSTVTVHVLVAKIFIDPPKNVNKTIVNHIDENGLNNYYKNLEWLTVQENGAYSTGKAVHQIDMDTGKIINTFNSIGAAARAINQKHGSKHIGNCCKGRQKWAYGYKWEFVKSD